MTSDTISANSNIFANFSNPNKLNLPLVIQRLEFSCVK